MAEPQPASCRVSTLMELHPLKYDKVAKVRPRSVVSDRVKSSCCLPEAMVVSLVKIVMKMQGSKECTEAAVGELDHRESEKAKTYIHER